LHVSANIVGVTAGPGAKQLLKQIFDKDDYDENSIPVDDDNKAIEVGIQFDLMQIVDLVSVRFGIRVGLREPICSDLSHTLIGVRLSWIKAISATCILELPGY
jgi:hypothetical protein